MYYPTNLNLQNSQILNVLYTIVETFRCISYPAGVEKWGIKELTIPESTGKSEYTEKLAENPWNL